MTKRSRVHLIKRVSGGYTQLARVFTPPAIGDVIRLEVSGSTLTPKIGEMRALGATAILKVLFVFNSKDSEGWKPEEQTNGT